MLAEAGIGVSVERKVDGALILHLPKRWRRGIQFVASANAQGFHVVGCMSIQGSNVYVLASVFRRYSDSRAYPIGYREEDFRAWLGDV